MRRSTPLSLPQPTRSARLTSFTLSFTPPGCLANSVDDDECEISHLAMPVGVAEDEDDEEDDSGGARRLRPCRLASRPHCWFGHSVKYSRTERDPGTYIHALVHFVVQSGPLRPLGGSGRLS